MTGGPWNHCPYCGQKKMIKGTHYETHDDDRVFANTFENYSGCGYSNKGESKFVFIEQ